jgi:hypothetical protein
MDSDKCSAQLERLEVVKTGRRRRWSEDEKLKIVLESLQEPRAVSIDSAALWHIALVIAELAEIVPCRAERSSKRLLPDPDEPVIAAHVPMPRLNSNGPTNSLRSFFTRSAASI